MRYLLITMLSIMGSITLAIAQKSERPPFKTMFIVGGNLLVERPLRQGFSIFEKNANFGASLVPDFGASFEARFTRHSGIESGLYYRNIRFPAYRRIFNSFPGPSNQEEYNPKQLERYLTIPVLYKLYTKTFNFAAGINYSRLIDRVRSRNAYINAERSENVVSILIKFSSDIQVHKRILIEPFIQYEHELGAKPDNFNPTQQYYWIGGGIGIKYVFTKR